ncbi:MAG: hypothetical protein KDC46_00735 [Thermoleophilia bacterium]|nr:hypothetical protein [Thermoleophilia bacterium]
MDERMNSARIMSWHVIPVLIGAVAAMTLLAGCGSGSSDSGSDSEPLEPKQAAALAGDLLGADDAAGVKAADIEPGAVGSLDRAATAEVFAASKQLGTTLKPGDAQVLDIYGAKGKLLLFRALDDSAASTSSEGPSTMELIDGLSVPIEQIAMEYPIGKDGVLVMLTMDVDGLRAMMKAGETGADFDPRSVIKVYATRDGKALDAQALDALMQEVAA